MFLLSEITTYHHTNHLFKVSSWSRVIVLVVFVVAVGVAVAKDSHKIEISNNALQATLCVREKYFSFIIELGVGIFSSRSIALGSQSPSLTRTSRPEIDFIGGPSGPQGRRIVSQA